MTENQAARARAWLRPFVLAVGGCLPWEKAPPKYLAFEGQPSTWGLCTSEAKKTSVFWGQSRENEAFWPCGKKSRILVPCKLAGLWLFYVITLLLHWESKEGTALQDGDLPGGRNQLSLEGKMA